MRLADSSTRPRNSTPDLLWVRALTSPRFQDVPTNLHSKTCHDRPIDEECFRSYEVFQTSTMTRQQIFSLFHPALFTPSRSSSFPQITKRWSHSTGEPFILPRIAIDLDAPDNPAVREYNEETDTVIPKKALEIQIATHIALRRKQRIEKSPVKVRKWKQPHVTPLDLIAYALFGKSCILQDTTMPIKTQTRLRKVFRQHAVDYQDTADVTVKKLTEDFEWGGPTRWIELRGARGGEGRLGGFRGF